MGLGMRGVYIKSSIAKVENVVNYITICKWLYLDHSTPKLEPRSSKLV